MSKKFDNTFYLLHVGELIKKEVKLRELSNRLIMMHFGCAQDKVTRMFLAPHLRTDVIIKWNELLGIDLFLKISETIKILKMEQKKSSRKVEDIKIFFLILFVFLSLSMYGQNKSSVDAEHPFVDSSNLMNNFKSDESSSSDLFYIELPSSLNSDVVVSFDSIHQVKNYTKSKNVYNQRKQSSFFKINQRKR